MKSINDSAEIHKIKKSHSGDAETKFSLETWQFTQSQDKAAKTKCHIQ